MRFAVLALALVSFAGEAFAEDAAHAKYMERLFKEARDQGAKEKRAADKANAPPHLTAEQLTHLYVTNELAADKRYKGKEIKVTGAVSTVEKTDDGVRVELDGGEGFQLVRCELPASAEDAATELQENQRVTMLCTVEGRTEGFMRYLHLTDCEFSK